MQDRRYASHVPELRDERVLIVGLGRSGLAAARFAAARHARVTITDNRPEAELGRRIDEARALGATIRAGAQPGILADAADLIVVSPGVPPDIELLRRAHELGLPVWGEIELASRFCSGRIIGVTGSNGKSTVTTMIGAILGPAARVGGNLDRPFAELLEPDAPDTIYVLELSSFQLETLESMRPEIALMLNLSPDHLDRYPDYEAYAKAKARLLELQTAEGYALLNADDDESERFSRSVRGKLSLFSIRREVEHGAFLHGDRLVLRTSHRDEELMQRTELPLPGDHNVANALAAALAARLVGCRVPAIADALRDYRPLPHRLERVDAIRGVTFYNDSKATNPASAVRALTAFEPGRVRLILGGRDKGADWGELVRSIGERVRQVLLVGESAEELEDRLKGRVAVKMCGTVPEAVAAGFADAVDGDVVLLSPGCASFDQYRNFEERGEEFRETVRQLARGSIDRA